MTLSRNTSASAAKAAPSRPAEEKSFFDWIKSSMAADGLLVPAPWQDEHAALASAEFTDKCVFRRSRTLNPIEAGQ